MRPLPKIPGYELLTCLGGGPLTNVFAARACAGDTPCAVKVIREDYEEPSTAIKLLQREARAGLAVTHPNLVRLLDVHVTRPPYYLVMEMLAGESLRARLRRAYRLDMAHSLWFVRQTAEALAALHREGFIHGDVKPENVRLVGDGTAILIDLGFAHRPGENAEFLRQGYVLGTANYLAPELCGSAPRDDLSSDIYSLGVMFFEMLAGTLPYPAGTVAQTLRRHLCDPPARLVDHAGLLPAALTEAVEKMLARQPAERPRALKLVQQLVGLEIATLRRRAA
jgi:serine/threonine protein kinase